MRRFHGTAATQLVLDEVPESRGPGVPEPRGPGVRRARIRLMQKDMYAELARRRRRAQIAARRWVDRVD